MTIASQAPAALEAARSGTRSTASVGRLLASSAVRYHPAPWVEERLAARLARAATGAGGSTAPASTTASSSSPTSSANGRLVAFPGGPAGSRAARQSRRNLLVGGAIASGVSLAGAALVAWRHGSRLHAPWRMGRRAAG